MLTGGAYPQKARFGIVLLHGRGAGARDILEFGAALALPDVAFVAPEAAGRSWWPTSFLAPAMQMKPYVTEGLSEVRRAIGTFTDAGIARNRIGVMGFSQGGCLALEYLAREGAGLGFGAGLSAGLVGLDDAGDGPDPSLYGYADKAMDYDTDLSGVQIYASCHMQDPHIPHARFTRSAARLQDMGANMSARSKPGAGHGIDTEDVAALRAMLNHG